jgi:hypothetical protein
MVALGPVTVSASLDWSNPGSQVTSPLLLLGESPLLDSGNLIWGATPRVLGSDVFLGSQSSRAAEFFVCRSAFTPSPRLRLQIDAAIYGTAKSSVFSWDVPAASVIITGPVR